MNSAIAALKDSGEFDAAWYLSQHPDVKLLGMDPAEHFLWIGKRLGRKGSPRAAAGAGLLHVGAAAVPSATGGVQDYLMREAAAVPPDENYPVTNFMHYLWNARPDLQAFDLTKQEGRIEYCAWFLNYAQSEYRLKPRAFPARLLETFSKYDGHLGEKARSILDEASHDQGDIHAPRDVQTGANLIGYAREEFGMGEHVRMVAECLDTTEWPFGIINVQAGGVHTSRDKSVDHWVSESSPYAANIFHVNADMLPSLYPGLGPDFFAGRYNIGYWAWELPNCPPEFDTAINMMDEIWGISEFVTDGFRQRCSIPVVNMPLAVELPKIQGVYTKEHFGVANEDFLFLFTFDSASYIDRKNPIAVVRAFRQAFPHGSERVRLILKTMNVPPGNPKWDALVREAEQDPRITIMTTKLLRDELLGLTAVCDAFVSLHRSEGFGRCMAEAMLWGKPVVATGYSGTADFIRPDTACVVDWRLIPVAAGEYPFWRGQEWADPDPGHAAMHMRRLVQDAAFCRQVAQAGQCFIRDNFNKQIIGARYAERLEQLQSRSVVQMKHAPAAPIIPASQDEIRGNVEAPSADPGAVTFGPNISIGGWAVSKAGIKEIVVMHGDDVLGHAHLEILRSDVGQDHPDMADPARSGYWLQVDTSRMPPGRRTLRVLIKSKSGYEVERSHEFTLGDPEVFYQTWLSNNVRIRSDEQPLLSVVLAGGVTASGADPELALRTIDSLARQRHSSFEIVLPTELPSLIFDLVRAEAGRRDIRVHTVEGTWCDCVRAANGDFVSVIELGDVFDPRATEALLANIESDSEVDFVYADDDLLVDGRRMDPRFKPAWSPALFRGHNYIGRPWFARTSIAAAVDLPKSGALAELETELLRQTLTGSRSICHIPTVLASLRSRPKPAKRASVQREHEEWPRVSIIMPCKLAHQEVIERCLKGILEETDYPDLEVFVITSGSSDKMAAGTWLKKWPIKRLHWADGYFNWSAINNLGARHASGDLLLFMNDDMAPLGPNWLKEMVRLSRDKDIGIVGAMLEYPNGRIQHAGICIGEGAGFHVFRYLDPAEQRIAWLAGYDREVSAATGACILTRRECYDAVGGFDEELPIVCNDTDFGLRMWEKGYSSVVSASARLIHYEGISRAGLKESEDVIRFQARWRQTITQTDPFFNPNLDFVKGDWSASSTGRGSLVGRSRSNKH